MTTVLKLDRDERLGRKGAKAWSDRIGLILRRMRVEPLGCAWHLTGHGHHVRILVRGWWSQSHLVALQAVLGSDPLREALNIRRLREGVKESNVLFGSKVSLGPNRARITRERRSRALERVLERSLGLPR